MRHVAGDVSDVLERVERRFRGLAAISIGEHAQGAILRVPLEDAAARWRGFFDALGEAALDVRGHRVQVTVCAATSVTATQAVCRRRRIEDLKVREADGSIRNGVCVFYDEGPPLIRKPEFWAAAVVSKATAGAIDDESKVGD
jgi:hypothetical protein